MNNEQIDRKYEILFNRYFELRGEPVYRIRALRDIPKHRVKVGDIGGYISGEVNLSQDGDCWVGGDSVVQGSAQVSGNAIVCGNTEVLGRAAVRDDARVCYSASVRDDALVAGRASLTGSAQVTGYAQVTGDAQVGDYAHVTGHAKVADSALILGFPIVKGRAVIKDFAVVRGNAVVKDDATVAGHAAVADEASVGENALLDDYGFVKQSAKVGRGALIRHAFDVMIFSNTWSSSRMFNCYRNREGGWTWAVGCFIGASKELVAKAYKDSEMSGDCYKAAVEYAEKIYKRVKAGEKDESEVQKDESEVQKAAKEESK